MSQNPADQATALDIDNLYRDRAHILSLLALHYPACIAHSDQANPDWPVLMLETPTGQMTWHLAARDLDLFPHVRREPDAEAAAQAYDGHTTADKHRRITDLTGRYPSMVSP
jgi:hypothetical protein